MARRLLVPTLRAGPNPLPPDQAHHAREVLRLGVGDEVELFTPAGQTAAAIITQVSADAVIADARDLHQSLARFDLTIASAIPKAARADWMIEKLSELGVARFVPLITVRSVVHPQGQNKLQRWQRLAAESAKQCHRPGVMAIAPLTPLLDALADLTMPAAYLSTQPGSSSLTCVICPSAPSHLTLLVGPEGGWAPDEVALFSERHLTSITLGETILRIETAAIAAAAVVATLTASTTRTADPSTGIPA